MAEVPYIPESFLDPALARAEKLEGAFRNLAKTVYLELADIEARGELSDEQKAQLSKLGDMTVRMSGLMESLNSSIGDVLGEDAPASFSDTEQPADFGSAYTDMKQDDPAGDLGDDMNEQPIPSLSPYIRELPGDPIRLKECDSAESEFHDILRERIISLDEIPLVELLDGEEPVDIVIATDNTLVINGKEITLVGDKLFAFNAFMMLRDGRISAGTVRRMGFRPPDKHPDYAARTCNKVLGHLQENLNTLTGIDAIKRVKAKYQISPTLRFIDERDKSSSEEPEGVKKN